MGPCRGNRRAGGLQGFAGSVSLGFSACLATVSCVLLDAANQQLESLSDKPEIGEHWSPRDFLDFKGGKL